MDGIAAIIAVCVIIILAVAVFFLGPQLLGAFFKKADEWQEIIDGMKGEK